MQKLCNRDSYAFCRSILSRAYNRLFKSRYNRSRMLFSFAIAGFCFMLFNLSTVWAQSPDSREAAERQTRTLTGTVLSRVSGQPIEGVSIRADGSSVRTDERGRFRITATKNTGEIEVR